MSSRGATPLRLVYRNDLTSGARQEEGEGRGSALLEPDDTAYATFLGWVSKPSQEAPPVSAPVVRPIQILDLGSDRLSLTRPLPVSLEANADEVVARSYDLELFEAGETDGEALDSLRAAIVELFFALRDMEPAQRSRYLTQKLQFLETVCRCP